MKPALLDTDIVSFFLRGNRTVRERVANYLQEYNSLNLSIITYYEIYSGLKYRDSQNRLSDFKNFVALNNLLPLTQAASDKAGQLYAELRQKDQLIDDIDLLIAGIALTNQLTLVTHNQSHFNRIPDLKIEDWTE